MSNIRRLASFLLDCRQHLELFDSKTQMLRLPMSRFDIADYLGTSPESLARTFARLEREGFVQRASPRSVRLCDADALARLVRGTPLR
ncbi:MAG TPA: helix-turn-helix domain-containing protein [Acetobacteraceae bacterium]|nr:helix-turn-helix domain-containing protein [Acetobacteraceae bacterium]